MTARAWHKSDTGEMPGAIVVGESFDEYGRRRGECVTSHMLADFRKAPLLYRKKYIDGTIRDQDSPAYLVGRAAHCFVMEGRDEFDARYVVGGPINEKTGKPFGTETKAYAEWAASHAPKEALSEDQYALIYTLSVGVGLNRDAAEIIAACTPECVVRTVIDGVHVQSRIDGFCNNFGIVDLKTCDDLTWFEADARRYGYPLQMAFYRMVTREATGHTYPITLVAVEKREPFRCGVWIVDETLLALAEEQVRRELRELKSCLDNDTWPTRFEDRRVLSFG